MPNPNHLKKPIRVLVCEDDAGILEVIGIALQNAGFESIPLSDGEELDRAMNTVKPDVVLLDMWLRGQHSESILKRFKKGGPKNRPRIILMSADSSLPSLAETYKMDYILKPFSLDDLSKVIYRNVQ